MSNYITGDSAFAVNRRGDIVLWNDAAEKAFGYTDTEALGKKCWELLSGRDTYDNKYCYRHCPVREMAFNHEPVNSFHSAFMTASEEFEPFNVSCVNITGSDGKEMMLHICQPVRDVAKEVQPNVATTTAARPNTLSDREVEILTMLANKVSTRKIASNLSISIKTVRTHIQHLMLKLQVHKRSDAVEAAKNLKLI